MKALKTMTSGNTSRVTATVGTLMALYLLLVVSASGYVVGIVQHEHKDRPPPSGCTFWGLMQHNPHGKTCNEEIK